MHPSVRRRLDFALTKLRNVFTRPDDGRSNTNMLPVGVFTEVLRLQRRLRGIQRRLDTANAMAGGAALRQELAAIGEGLQTFEDRLGQQFQCPSQTLEVYRSEIDRLNAAQPNHVLLDAIRQYNHDTVDALHSIRSLEGASLLDVGASPHGYALERALVRRARRYVGIGLDVSEHVLVWAPDGIGELVNADAQRLPFEDECFDLVVSMSTFEHIAHVDRALSEIHRVTKERGLVLITFEPLWTCSYGHHLHHFGPVSNLMPAWAHLIWSKEQMLEELRSKWPEDAPLSVEEAAEWVYDGDALNRVGIRDMRRLLNSSHLSVEWVQPLMDDPRDAGRLDIAIRATGFDRDELMTKGFSALFRR
jgi:ubiquinone/menaquinone biosynthesis C-methylase UbiE